MPTPQLIPDALDRLEPPEAGRIDYLDPAFPPLGLRITARGERSWVFFYRFGTRQRRMTLGPYPGMSLDEAREAAHQAMHQIRIGVDPKGPVAGGSPC